MSSGLNTGCALRPGIPPHQLLDSLLGGQPTDRLLRAFQDLRRLRLRLPVFQLRVVYHRPSNLYMDSRDTGVLIVHKGIPELAESDRLGTWGGVRVGGPGVSSPQGYPPAFLAPVFQLRVVYDRPSALYMDSRDTGVLIVHKVSPRSSRRETRSRSPGLHKPAPCLLLGIKPLVAGYAWAPWRRSTRRRSLLNPVD